MKIGISRIKVTHVFTVLFLFCLVSGCSYAQGNKEKIAGTKAKREFTLPDIPRVLTTSEDRAEYLVSHYWDNFDFTDTVLISKPEVTEQAFVDFIDLLHSVSYDKATKAFIRTLDAAMNADSRMFAHFAEMSEKYLYDPNSPLRNEEYYIPVLQYIVSSPKIDEINKIRPRYQLELAMKNRPGMISADFTYTLRNGKTGKMSGIAAEYTILYFNNPDCHDCKRVRTYMANSSVINELLGDNSLPCYKRRLAILSIYPDADLPIWLQADYPKSWINGYDAKQVITKEPLYDLKAIPTIYLLNKDKRVILKDVSAEVAEAWLREHAEDKK